MDERYKHYYYIIYNIVFKFTIRNMVIRRTLEDFSNKFNVDVIGTCAISPSQNENNSIIFHIIYVPSQQLQGQVHEQRDVMYY
jgi:hypothetical protein